MTNEQILEQQVEALEKLLKLKQAVVEELEAKVARLENPYGGVQVPFNPYIQPFIPHNPFISVQDTCPSTGSFHEYPSLWGSSNPPNCTKCGKAQWGGAITGIHGGAGSGQVGIGGASGSSTNVTVTNGNSAGTTLTINEGLNRLIDTIKNR